MISADHHGNPNQVTVTFSEPIVPATATNLANYQLKSALGVSIPIQSAKLLSDEKTVQLSGVFNFVLNAEYQLTVQNVDDQAVLPNRLLPNPSVISFSFTGAFLGPIGFATGSQLHDLSVVENRTAHFEAGLTGAQPWFYQWLQNGVAVPGATNSSFELVANAAISGASFSVIVSNEFSTAASSIVHLTVVPDVAPPKLVSVKGLAGLNEILLTFDEPISAESATNIANFAVDNIPISRATLSADGTTIAIFTGVLQLGQIYLVSLQGIKDRSLAGNALAATASFATEASYPGEVLADSPVRYWRFDETDGTTVASLAAGVDAISVGTSTLNNNPTLGVASLVPSEQADTALQFNAGSSQNIAVPNGSDLNVGGPWAKKSIEFWFRAASAPAIDATGLDATAGICEQGAATRNIAAYLWRDPANANPDQAALVFHAFNNATDGPGSPFGLTTLPAVFVQYTIEVGQTYHVVAVFDGDPTGLTGNLILYVNGAEVGRVGGVGQIYAHTGDVQIGRGNGVIHTGDNGNLGFFDGVLDDLSTYNTALTAARVTAHYQAGIGSSGGNATPPAIARVDTRGNANLALVTFSKPVDADTATNPVNFTLKTSSGVSIPIQTATLLGGGLTVQLGGVLNFQSGVNYTLSVKDITDQSTPPNTISPNPATSSFGFTNGAVAIGASSDLATRNAFENQIIHFVVVPAGTAPFTYQWFKNGVAIPDQNRSDLVVTATSATVGSYTVKVSNDFSTVTSSSANITLSTDLTPPHLTTIQAVAGSINEVRLTFDESVDPITGVNIGNYNLGALAVLSASVSTNGLGVTLQTAPQQNGQTYTLAITGLKDRAAAGNVLNTNVVFATAASYVDEILADAPVRYWRFEETTGTAVATSVARLDSASASSATLVNGPKLGVPGLVSNLIGSTAIQFIASTGSRLTVPNGSDLNAVAGPWAKKSFQFWFNASSVPAPDTTGLAAATAALWEQGAASRNISVYLWRDPANPNPDEAALVFNALNNVAADGVGSPYGPPGGNAVFDQSTIKTGQTYHVVAVFDGDNTGLNGNLILYVNGVEVGRIGGVGQIYNHTGDIQIGHGNGLIHTGENGDLGPFDGVIDELSLYNTALSAERVSELYQIGNTVPPAFVRIDTANSDLSDRITLAGQPVHLEVATTGNGPFTYQWYRNGSILPGETNSALTFTAAAANAGNYTVTIDNAFSSVTSNPVRVTVQSESTAPQLVSSDALAGYINEIRLTFSRPVDSVSATNLATYNLSGASLLNALLSADGLTVTLETSPQQTGANLSVSINGLKDRVTPDGVLNSTVAVQSRLSYGDEILTDGPVRYWHFNESGGTNVASVISALDALNSTTVALYDGPTLGVEGLVPNLGSDTAIAFTASQTNRLLVPNGSDLNITAGPWSKKSFSLWFKAATLPRGGASPQAPVLWEQGGDSRGAAIYLYGTQDVDQPNEAALIWNVYNNAADGVTGGWGVKLGNSSGAVYVSTPVQANQVYNVVGVFNGDTQGTNGTISLYVNGALAGSVGGAGQLFNHSSDIQIGRGSFVRHDGITAGNIDYYDGVLDELAIYSKALSAERVAQLYQIGLANSTGIQPAIIADVKIQGGNIVISWEGSGKLEAADTVNGTYTPVANTGNPYSEPVEAKQRFFRLVP